MRHPERPRIFRVCIRLANGRLRRLTIKATYYEKDPGDSLFGLQSKLADLTLAGAITYSSVTVPATITPGERSRLVRWSEAFARLGLGEVVAA